MEVHNEFSFLQKEIIVLYLKENTQHLLPQKAVRLIKIGKVEFSVYSEDAGKAKENMQRPEILFEESVEHFSPKSKFNIYSKYELKSSIRDRLLSIQLLYDDPYIEILTDHTNLTLEHIMFRRKIIHV